MDSAALQHSPTPALPTTTTASNHSSINNNQSTSRVRAYTTVPNSKTVDPRGAIQKRGNSRSRTISASQTDHLFRLVAEQQQQQQPQHIHSPEAHHAHISSSNVGIQWLTPQHSPVPSVLSADASIEPFPSWTVPTPPRSDSGIPTVSLDVNEDPVVTTALCTSAEFTEFEHPTASAEMSSLGGSSLGFLLPSTYGPGVYDTDPNSYPMDQNYMPPMRMSQAAVTSGAAAYAPTATSSPAMYQSSAHRRPDMPPSSHSYGRVTGSPYDSPVSNYSVAPGQTIPSISGLTHSPLPSPPMSSSGTPMMPQYSATSMPRSPNMYDQSVYGQPFTSAPSGPQMYAPVQGMPPYAPQYVGNGVNDMMAKPVGGDGSIRVLNQRPKPQCWDHGCNGRQFSTFSNLLRHQREKSGTSTKSYCPKCGAEFTRTTARNGHLAHDKCTKNRRQTESK